MTPIEKLQQALHEQFADHIQSLTLSSDQLTLEIPATSLLTVCKTLRDEKRFAFEMLVDVCGVDYLDYGMAEWQTETATSTGFDRAVEQRTEREQMISWDKPRFAVIYHLLSVTHNQRLRMRVFLDETLPIIPSVIDIWPSCDWFERETFDMFGIIFDGHPDLRRILTDYGFIGHPFRKDFPLSGHVEVRYDAEQGRVIYEPVDIEPRVLVPKVIRDDHRYILEATKAAGETK